MYYISLTSNTINFEMMYVHAKIKIQHIIKNIKRFINTVPLFYFW